ncbi:hypothetical protein ACJX0J_025293, partial [Zea mays]
MCYNIIEKCYKCVIICSSDLENNTREKEDMENIHISAKGISGITAYIITGTQILSSSTLTPLFSCITEHISSLFEDRLHVNYCYLLAYKIIQEKLQRRFFAFENEKDDCERGEEQPRLKGICKPQYFLLHNTER